MIAISKKRIREYFLTHFPNSRGFHKEENRLTEVYYHDKKLCLSCNTYEIILMIDGKTIHNGLSDRFKGICSAYHYAKKHGLTFKIHYVYPFDLETFLEPNKYDWRISPNQIIYNPNHSRPILINDYQITTYKYREQYLDRFVRKYNQLHLYTNALFGDLDFSKDFDELFKPSLLLQNEIDKYINLIGGKYISISLRFQSLLGDDFIERNSDVLDKGKADQLLQQSLVAINDIHEMNLDYKVVVFSDSNKFLRFVNDRCDFVRVIPGKVVHVDNSKNEVFDSYLKTFLDFFLIAKASKIYLLYNNLLYKSGFPKRASEIYNRPFYSIKF